jgi:uncharacterized protein YprB with RNaseH-like and TPR domain
VSKVPVERPRILLWDIETTPMVVTTWGLFKPHLSHDNIRQESLIITAAWKWLGEDKVDSVSINIARPRQDRGVIQRLHKVLGEADVLVGHNGDKFDLRKFNARAIFHSLAPLPEIPTIDTLKVAKKLFYFNSNRLDYLGKFLCGKGKIHTEYNLWLNVMGGDEKALTDMVRYNKEDVRVLEQVYLRLRPYMRRHPSAALYREKVCCPTCGGEEFQRRGWKYQQATRRQQFKCTSPWCGAWWSGGYEKKGGKIRGE